MILKYQKLATYLTKGVIKTISFPIHSTLNRPGFTLHCAPLAWPRTFHGSLQGVDGVDLCDNDAGTEPTQGLDAALAHVTIAGHHGHLARDHHVSGTLDAVDQALPAAVQVVELALHMVERQGYCVSKILQTAKTWERNWLSEVYFQKNVAGF